MENSNLAEKASVNNDGREEDEELRGESPSDIDKNNQVSLYEQFLDRLKLHERQDILHRFVFLAGVAGSHGDTKSQEQIVTWFQDTIKSIQGKLQGGQDEITGLLLMYDIRCIFVVETSSQLMLELANAIHNEILNPDEALIHSCRILWMVHDIPSRLYPQWLYRTMNPQTSKDEYEPTESFEKIVLDVLAQMMRLGVYIMKTPRGSLKSVLSELHEKVPDFIPPQDVVGYLVDHESNECMVPIQTYLNFYHQPVQVILDSELTWPMGSHIFPVLT